jgi:hypothetical protein
MPACSTGRPKQDQAGRFTHATLKNALGILLVAARVFPIEDLIYTVARRVFNLEHFVEFDRSDPAARSHLLQAAFGLLEIARIREVPVRVRGLVPLHNPYCFRALLASWIHAA